MVVFNGLHDMWGLYMIYEYYQQYLNTNKENCHIPHVYKKFDDYLIKHDISLSDAHNHINSFVDTIVVSQRTKIRYRRGLRDLLNCACESQGVVQTKDSVNDTYIVSSDGSYVKIN